MKTIIVTRKIIVFVILTVKCKVRKKQVQWMRVCGIIVKGNE